jgi:hypothetical protein
MATWSLRQDGRWETIPNSFNVLCFYARLLLGFSSGRRCKGLTAVRSPSGQKPSGTVGMFDEKDLLILHE